MPAIIAHRLGRAYGPDSSRQALRRSLSEPLDGLETDCCLTADGQLVLLHDPLLALGTTTSGWAHERTAAQILGGRLLDHHGQPTTERPMLLDELLELAPADVMLQLEIKAHGDPALAVRTAGAVCERLEGHPARSRCEILSFWSGACEQAAALGFPSRLVMIAEYEIDALRAWASRVGVHGVCIEHFLLFPALVESLRQTGLSVSTGTRQPPRHARHPAADEPRRDHQRPAPRASRRPRPAANRGLKTTPTGKPSCRRSSSQAPPRRRHGGTGRR